MSFDEFIAKYKGKGVDVDNYPPSNPYQCVDLIRQYIKEVLNQPQPRGVVGAKDFWTNYESDPNLNQYFDKIPNTPSGVPSKGDIIIWGNTYGSYGHIAIINWANVNQVQALTQNDPIGSLTILKNYSYNHILGWFSPKGNNMSDMYNGYDLSNRESMKVAVDVLVRVQKGEFVEKSKLDELVKVKTAELSSKISNYEETIKKLNTALENCNTQTPGEDDLEQNSELNGWGSTELFYNEKNQVIKKINKNYKVKE